MLGKRTLQDPSALMLVAVNLAAAVYAFFHPPAVLSVMALYWFECVVVGAYTVPKLFFVPILLGPLAEARPLVRFALNAVGKTIVAAFFVAHYGAFLWIVTLFAAALADYELQWRSMHNFDVVAYLAEFKPAMALVVVGHGISFIANFVRKEEWRARVMEQQMLLPYKRVMLMLGAILLGTLLVAIFRPPIVILAGFVALKIVADLHAHFRDHAVHAPRGAQIEDRRVGDRP